MDERGVNAAEEIEDQLVKTFAFGSWINMLGIFTGRAMHFVSQVLLANFMSASDFGLYSIGWNFLRFLGFIAPLGLDYGVIYKSAKKQGGYVERWVYIRVALILAFISGLIIFMALWFFSTKIAFAFNKPGLEVVVKIIAVSFPFYTFMRVGAAATRIENDMRVGILAEEFGQPFSNLALILLFFGLGVGLIEYTWAAAISFFVGSAIPLGFMLYSSIWLLKPRVSDFLVSSSLLRFSVPSAFTHFFANFIILTDRLFVAYFLSDEEAGIYQAVSLISVLFVALLSSVRIILAPMVADLYGKQEADRIKSIFLISVRWLLYVSLPIIAVLIVNSKSVIEIVFGPTYVIGSSALVILTIAQIFNMFTGGSDQVLVMTGNQNKELIALIGIFTINVFLNIVLIPRFGINGGALSTMISYIGIMIANNLLIWKFLGFWPYNRSVLKALTAFFGSMVSVYFINALGFSIVFNIAIGLVLSFGVFIFILWILKLENEDRQLVLLVSDLIMLNKNE